MMNEVWVILVPYQNWTSDREEAIIFFVVVPKGEIFKPITFLMDA